MDIHELIKMFEDLLFKGRRKMSSRFRDGIDERVSNPQIMLLHYIKCQGSCTVSSIAAHIGVTPSAVTGLVDKLLEMEYVTRVRSTDDRRVVYVGMTDSGENLINKVYENKIKFLKELLSSLTEEEAAVFRKALEKLMLMYFDEEE